MLHFNGYREFSLPPDQLWAKLTDARFLVSCIPDVESVSEAEADHAALVLRPGLAFVRGSLETTLRIVPVAPPHSAKVLLYSKGIGTYSAVEAGLQLAPQGDGTRVHWTAEVKELGGLLKMVPQGLIRGAAEKVINDLWASIERKLSGAGEPGAHPGEPRP